MLRNYLAMEKAVPFVAPKVEQATPKGTIHAKDPNTRDPKVIATAFELSISDPVMTGQSGYIIRKYCHLMRLNAYLSIK